MISTRLSWQCDIWGCQRRCRSRTILPLGKMTIKRSFSRMRSKGSCFTLGVWGLKVCLLDVAFMFATVRSRSQTVCSRPRDPHMAVPMVSSAKGVTFGGFTCGVASFRVAGVALCDIQTCFGNVSKVFFCGRRNTFATFFRRCVCSFRGRRSTLDVSIGILRGRRSALDASCCVFFYESHWQGCVKWRQGANSVAGAAFCEMC